MTLRRIAILSIRNSKRLRPFQIIIDENSLLSVARGTCESALVSGSLIMNLGMITGNNYQVAVGISGGCV